MAKLQSRWAHASEVTALAFVPDGSYIVATADDFALHLFSQKEGKPARQAEPIESTEGATCIAVTQENIYAGSRDGVIRQYDIKLQEFMGIIVRCNLAVRCLALSKNQKLLGIGTEENEIKIINLEDPEECFPLQGHKKAINAIAFDPLAEYMLSSSCDGTVIVWDMKTKKSAPLEIITVMAPTSTESKYKIPIAWHTSGEFFVIGRDKDITAHHRHTWQKSFTYRSGSSAAPTILAWSPNGRYLAAASIETDIWIWKYKEKEQPHIKHTHKTGVTDLTWSPSRNCLAFADAAGEVTYWEEVIEDGTPLKEPTPDPLKGLFDEPTARGNEIGAQETEGAQKDHDMGDLAQEYLSDNESLRDFIVDDENDPYLQKKASTGAQKSGALGMRVAKALHPRFQPGSTAERDKRRYLAFNLLGLITTVDHGNHATVSVEFHDKLTHRGYHFTDGSHYTMACLGMTGALFAAPERAETPSTVFFRTYDSWATKSEWQIFLPEGEDVTAIALNAESAIVSTSRGFVRIFSQSGIQTGLFSLGSVIAAVGKDDMVFFIYHQGEPFEGSQNLGYSIYNVETAQRIQHGLLPVLDDTIITWLGFSEGGIPAFYDDKGVMYILNYYRRVDQGQWTPILDTTAVQNTESDTNNVPHYWLVGLTDQTATFVKCRRGETEPSFPKPFVTELPLKVLTLHQDTPAGQHEEAWLRNKILSGLNKDEKIARSIESIDNSAAKRELEMDKLALQMIDLACRADRTQKALDLTAMLCSLKSIDNAMKIAQHHSLHTLMERMSRVKEIKMMEEQGRDPEEERELIMADPVVAVSSRKKDQDSFKISSREEEEDQVISRKPLQRQENIKPNDPFGRRVVKSNQNSTAKTASGGNGGTGVGVAANPFKKKSHLDGSGSSGSKAFGVVASRQEDRNLPITRRATDVFEAADYLAADEQRSKAQRELARQEEAFKKRKAGSSGIANGASSGGGGGGQRTLTMFSKAVPAAVEGSETDAKRFKVQQQQQEQQQEQQRQQRSIDDTDMMMDADEFLEGEEAGNLQESPVVTTTIEEGAAAASVRIPATQDEDFLIEESIEEARGHLEKTAVESSTSPPTSPSLLRNSSSVLAGFRFNTSS